MAIPSRQIGWGTEENLLWQISKQLEYLSGITYNSGGGSGSGTSGSSGTSGGSGTSGSAGTAGLSGSSGSSGVAGTSGLSGDRYKTESVTEFTLGTGGTITVGTGLSYTTAQDIIIAYDSTHHQVSMVTSYDSGTGILVFGAPSETTGTGTYSDWTVNLNGAAGGNGTNGTSGSAGTSGLSGTSGVAGTSGSAGTSGATGTNGSSGTSASSGTAGTAGVAGTAGTSGTSYSPPLPVVFGLYAQTANSATVTNTTTETTIVGTGVGSLSVAANGFSIGDSFLGRIVGHISSKNNDTIRIKIKSGSVILGDTGVVTMPQTTTKHYTVDLNFTVRTIGAAGVASIATGMVFTYSKDASNAFEGYNSTIINNTTFDTTSTNTLDVTVQWGAADALNSIYSEYFTLNKVY
jgi:hypothetical protein